jgi:uncharacterized membrane protein YjgN (DUF898 family)
VSKAPAFGGDDRISKVLLWWLLAISASFLVGFLLLALVPAGSGPTWGIGIVFNVSMAVGIGVSFGWTRQGLQILIAMVLGAVVTILGLDLLVLVPSPTENAHFGPLAYAAFDSVGVLIALFGMVILIGGGALAGVIAHLVLSRCGCLAHTRSNRKCRRRTPPFGPVQLGEVVVVGTIRTSIASH